jgi:hypothetical protein
MVPEVVQTAQLTGKVLYGGESNTYKAAPEQRQIRVSILKDTADRYRVTVDTGRAVPGHSEFVADYRQYSSPLMPEQTARTQARILWPFLRDSYTGQLTGENGIIPGNHYGATYCPECGRFDTLSTKQEAYGDATTCTTRDCAYNSWHSIGD